VRRKKLIYKGLAKIAHNSFVGQFPDNKEQVRLRTLKENTTVVSLPNDGGSI